MDETSKIIEELGRYKGIIFDFDGTIVNLNQDWQAVKNALSQFLIDEKRQEMDFTPLAEKMLYLRNGKDLLFYERILDILSSFEMKEKNYIFNKELLLYINSLTDKKIGIYSMNTSKTIKNIVNKYFKNKPDLISIENCSEPKPSGVDLLKIIKTWGLKNKEVAFVGNSQNDLLSGKKAGVKTYILKI